MSINLAVQNPPIIGFISSQNTILVQIGEILTKQAIEKIPILLSQRRFDHVFPQALQYLQLQQYKSSKHFNEQINKDIYEPNIILSGLNIPKVAIDQLDFLIFVTPQADYQFLQEVLQISTKISQKVCTVRDFQPVNYLQLKNFNLQLIHENFQTIIIQFEESQKQNQIKLSYNKEVILKKKRQYRKMLQNIRNLLYFMSFSGIVVSILSIKGCRFQFNSQILIVEGNMWGISGILLFLICCLFINTLQYKIK